MGDDGKTPSGDAELRPGSKRKLARKSLTLREKSIVKSFCEQKVADCKARGELAPSQEVLRRLVASQFGWSVGRSTLSKIISMDWKLLRGAQEGGDAPRNPDMKRRRRPLFPAFEADLVKFITTRLGADEGNGGAIDAEGEAHTRETGSVNSAELLGNAERRNGSQTSGRVLTEALILEEAQRLKQVHGVSDEMLMLSVGWLARFKHRHCIRLRKSPGVNKVELPLHPSLGVGSESTDPAPMEPWNEALLRTSLSQTQAGNEYSLLTENSVEGNGENSSSQQSISLESEEITPLVNPQQPALCSAHWYQDKTATLRSALTAPLEQLPESIRGLACSCQGSTTDCDLTGDISGLRVVVVGFGCVVKAFLAAASVGPTGFVTCVEASPASVYLAEQAAENYCFETLGMTHVNMKFIVGAYGGMSHVSSSRTDVSGDGLKILRGQADLVICNCSIQSLEFPASKNTMLELAYSLLKVGGELRVTDLVSTRRLSSAECEDVRFAMEASAGTDDSEGTTEVSKQFEQKLLLGAPYLGDLQRLYQALSNEVDVRTLSCGTEESSAFDAAVASLLPSLATTDDVRFRRVTFHVFRLEDIENPREDYGQTAIFKGDSVEYKTDGVADMRLTFRLDDDWNFERGVCTPIDGNTAQILQTTWMQRFFMVNGDRSRHRGPFVASTRSISSLPSDSSVAATTMHVGGMVDTSVSDPPTNASSTEPLEMVDI